MAPTTKTYRILVDNAGDLQRRGVTVTRALVELDRMEITVPANRPEMGLVAAFRTHGLPDATIGVGNYLHTGRTIIGRIERVMTTTPVLANVSAPCPTDDTTAIARAVGMTG